MRRRKNRSLYKGYGVDPWRDSLLRWTGADDERRGERNWHRHQVCFRQIHNAALAVHWNLNVRTLFRLGQPDKNRSKVSKRLHLEIHLSCGGNYVGSLPWLWQKTFWIRKISNKPTLKSWRSSSSWWEINESEEEEDEDFLNYYSSTFFDVHSDRLQEKQTYHHTAQVQAPSFTLQGWESDADDQDDIISRLTSVGFDSDSEPSKNCKRRRARWDKHQLTGLRKRKLPMVSLSYLQHPLRVCIRDVRQPVSSRKPLVQGSQANL